MRISVKVIRYERARWELPDGTVITEEIPEEHRNSHFGPELRSYIIYQSHQNRVPQEKIKQQLTDLGCDISSGQINAILANAALELSQEKEEILKEGIKSNSVHADDTGLRNKGKNGFTTVICNAFFTYLKSSDSKSRANFLAILRGQENLLYMINQDAIEYATLCGMGKDTYEWFVTHNNTSYTEEEFNTFINSRALSISDKRFITEACLIACCIASGVSPDLIIVSDGAGQFNLKIIQHALCWIHAERSLKKIVPVCDEETADLKKILDLIWSFYKELKDYKDNPSEQKKNYLNNQFDIIMSTVTSGYQIAPALKTFRDNKHKLLAVLDNPSIDLNNNIAERDVRHSVIQRKISGGTRSDLGRLARDVFVSLFKTCQKNGISIWAYLKDRLSKKRQIPNLGDMVKARIQSAASS